MSEIDLTDADAEPITRIVYDSRRPKQGHIVVFDLETSGLDPDVHEILQIGAFKLMEDTLEVVDRFEIKVKMEKPEVAQEEALKINGYDPDVWEKEAVEPWYAANEFASWLVNGTGGGEEGMSPSDHLQFAGHNIAGFDWPFICNLFRVQGVELTRKSKSWRGEEVDGEDDKGDYVFKSTIPASPRKLLDTGVMGAMLQVALGYAKLKSTSLRPLSRFCGFKHDEDAAHEAIYDCEMTVRVLRWFKAVLVAGNFNADQRNVERAWADLDYDQMFAGFKE